MPHQLVAADSQPCIWMCAGLISYRLCTRDFDCEHCPLDAALHGDLRAHGNGGMPIRHGIHACVWPGDRLYSTAHTWALEQSDHTWRIGLDGFGAALIGNVASLAWLGSERLRARGEPVCEVDIGLGVLPIGAPLPGRIVRHNQMLLDEPNLLITDPYGDGWIAELAVPDNAADAELLSPATARTQTTLDLRRFRRAIAIHLFAEATANTQHADESDQLHDLRAVIAGDGYLELLREFIH